jgi:hypothetical protein
VTYDPYSRYLKNQLWEQDNIVGSAIVPQSQLFVSQLIPTLTPYPNSVGPSANLFPGGGSSPPVSSPISGG